MSSFRPILSLFGVKTTRLSGHHSRFGTRPSHTPQHSPPQLRVPGTCLTDCVTMDFILNLVLAMMDSMATNDGTVLCSGSRGSVSTSQSAGRSGRSLTSVSQHNVKMDRCK